jgi:hypothetical protein
VTDVCELEVHEAIKRDRVKWKSLPYIGHHFYQGIPQAEVRNCPCTSTLYCACTEDDVQAVLEIMPLIVFAIRLNVSVAKVIEIEQLIAVMGVQEIPRSHVVEAIRLLCEDGRVRVDPYYDERGSKIYNRKVYAL